MSREQLFVRFFSIWQGEALSSLAPAAQYALGTGAGSRRPTFLTPFCLAVSAPQRTSPGFVPQSLAPLGPSVGPESRGRSSGSLQLDRHRPPPSDSAACQYMPVLCRKSTGGIPCCWAPTSATNVEKLPETMWKAKGTIVASWPSERRAVARATQSSAVLER